MTSTLWLLGIPSPSLLASSHPPGETHQCKVPLGRNQSGAEAPPSPGHPPRSLEAAIKASPSPQAPRRETSPRAKPSPSPNGRPAPPAASSPPRQNRQRKRVCAPGEGEKQGKVPSERRIPTSARFCRQPSPPATQPGVGCDVEPEWG